MLAPFPNRELASESSSHKHRVGGSASAWPARWRMMPASEHRQARIATTSAPDEEVIDDSNRRLRQRLFCASLLDLVRQGTPTLS